MNEPRVFVIWGVCPTSSYSYVGRRRLLSSSVALLRPSCVATFVLGFFSIMSINGCGKLLECTTGELRIVFIENSSGIRGFTAFTLISSDGLMVPIIPINGPVAGGLEYQLSSLIGR